MPSNKSDTIFRCASGSLGTDLSQYGTNLTTSGSGAYETSSTRTALDYSGRELTILFEADSGSLGTLLYRGDTSSTSIDFEISMNFGQFKIEDSTGTIYTATPPSLDGTLRDYNVQICTRPNPLTTGASDAFTTEVTFECVSPQDWLIEQFYHPASTHTSTHNFSIGGYWNGASLSSTYSDSIHGARVGSRFKSSTEFKLDASVLSDPTPSTGESQATPFAVLDASSGIGDGGEAAGPAYQLAGVHVRDSARRLVSPLVNTIYPTPAIQGRANYLTTTRNSTYDVPLTQASTATGESPGYGYGPSGSPERAREFDGVNKGAFEASGTPGFISYIQANDFTLGAMVRWDGSGKTGTICGLTGGGGGGGSANNDCCVLSVNSSDQLVFSWHHGSGTAASVTSTGTLTQGAWHYVGARCTINGANLDVELFIDDAEDTNASATKPSGGGSSTWQVGRRMEGGTASAHFEGAICEIKIADGALPGVTMDFEGTRAQGYLLPEDELAHWQFRQPPDGYEPARAFLTQALGDDTYKLHLDTLVKRPANPMTGKFEARVLATKHFTDPPGASSTSDEVKIAIVATNRRPGSLEPISEPVQIIYGTATISADDTLERHEFTDLTLPRDANGDVWICLASRIGDGSPTQTTGVSFSGLQVVPYYVEPTDSFPYTWGDP